MCYVYVFNGVFHVLWRTQTVHSSTFCDLQMSQQELKICRLIWLKISLNLRRQWWCLSNNNNAILFYLKEKLEMPSLCGAVVEQTKWSCYSQFEICELYSSLSRRNFNSPVICTLYMYDGVCSVLRCTRLNYVLSSCFNTFVIFVV